MYIIYSKYNKIVVDIVESVTEVENGLEVDNGRLIYANPGNDLISVEVNNIPNDVKPQKFCYKPEDGSFYPNPDWVEPIDPYETIRQLEGQVKTMQETINFLLGI
ncbi:hypothetical protein D478_26369 [Brevibacillus agri BAB-2500]|nr:hypothetical protein D478_26369 [Brevibacillus agri BAB-2500]